MYYVYLHYNNEQEIIYCGQTKDMNSRQSTHKCSSEWSKEIYRIEYTEVTDSMLMDIYEKYYISKYNPKYNKKDINCKYSRFFTGLEELEFIEYKTDNVKAKRKFIRKPRKRFAELFEEYYAKSLHTIEKFKEEFNRTGSVVECEHFKYKLCVKNEIKCNFSISGDGMSYGCNLLIGGNNDCVYYIFKSDSLNLNRYNYLKTEEQRKYKSLDDIWNEIGESVVIK